MSLVLNTNASGGGWYVVSNESLWMFPDFQNASQLVIDRALLFDNGATVNDWHYVESVNWTKINFRCSSIVAPDYRLWVNWSNSWTLWLWIIWNRLWTWTKRRWLQQKLNWWETVWKQIIFPAPLYLASWTAGGWYHATDVQIDMTVGLLHSDWTISQLWTTSFTPSWWSTTSAWWIWTRYNPETNSWRTMMKLSWMALNWTQIVSWQWVVAQAWDYIVLTITYAIKTQPWSWWVAVDFSQWVWFWYKYSLDDYERYSPVQVSID